uniref:Nucleolar protein with MIF4G domain 1 n=1 Tax=Rattus norvegicus TaxID=10116 RepID=M0R6J5_RAT
MARTKCSGVRRGPGGGKGPLKRLRLAVEGFVRATSESEACENRSAVARSRPGDRKSRKELRKKKRQLRKVRRLQRTVGSGSGDQEGNVGLNGGPETRPRIEMRPTPAKATATPVKASAPSANTKASATQPKANSSYSKGTMTSTQAKAKGAPGKPGPATATARKRALLAANEEEDREIRKLERCLGLHKRKKGDGSSVPLSFARDGLDYILGALEYGRSGGLYESSDEEEEGKVETGQTFLESDPESNSEESEEDPDSQVPQEDQEDVNSQKEGETESGTRGNKGNKKVRFAEVVEKSESSLEDDLEHQESHCVESGEKYIPPQLRSEETVDVQKKEELDRLKKHVKGLINRLSEPNMASISGQLEELYMAHSRKYMNDTLTAVLMDACVTTSTMPSRLMMEHVFLVSILHHTVGTEVGACFLEAVVKKFDDVYRDGGEGKELDNLFTMIAHLYNFHVVQSLLIFDILKKLVGTFTERDIELILLMLKNVGFALRKDDALSLKELITEAQAQAIGAGNKFQDQNRVRFMLETMLALKNNDMRKIPGYNPEPVEKLKKLQRALASSKMLELARKQRMNTDVRRNIFCTMMTSEDFLDAFEKLLKLGLKDQQEREIVHILMDCCLQEKTYNPFYAFLASKFCAYERRFQMTFQFSIWDKFRDLENLSGTKFSNLVYLLTHLLKTKSLPLSVLKVVEFSELDKPRVHFLRRVLTELLMETEDDDLVVIFSRVSSNPKLGMLREGLKLFISHFLLKPAQPQQSAEKASLLRERAGLASKSLQGKAILRM